MQAFLKCFELKLIIQRVKCFKKQKENRYVVQPITLDYDNKKISCQPESVYTKLEINSNKGTSFARNIKVLCEYFFFI